MKTDKEKETLKKEKPAITRNRPFNVFVVKQLSYKSQYKTFAMNLDDLKLLTVVG